MNRLYRINRRWMALASIAVLGLAGAAEAGIRFSDAKGDDHGPGSYRYPTDTVYKKGSFDITGLAVDTQGENAVFEVTFDADLEDAWGTKTGFSTQTVLLFIDLDGVAGSGYTDSLPGLNLAFASDSAWERVLVLSPQPAGLVRQELAAQAGERASAVLVPGHVHGKGRTITAKLPLAEILGDPSQWGSAQGDPSQWGFQAVVLPNEASPAPGELLTRKVNEYEGQHRFGGGVAAGCDPQAIDVLGGAELLAFECSADGRLERAATLTMVRGEAKASRRGRAGR